jgi:hypothetical protein
MAQQRIKKRQHAIHRIARRTTVPSVHRKFLPDLRAQVFFKHLEMERRGLPLDPARGIRVCRHRELPQQMYQHVGYGTQGAGIRGFGGIARAAIEEPAGVVDFPRDKRPRDFRRTNRVGGCSVLDAPEVNRTPRDAFNAGLKTPPFGEITNAGPVFPAKPHRGRRHINVGAEHEQRFAIMDGKRELELAVLLDAERKPIPINGELGREEIEGVLKELGQKMERAEGLKI